MSVDKDTVRRIAHLARIRLEDKEVEPVTEKLNGILNWVEELQSVDTENVQPMTSAVETKLHWRKDEVTDGNDPDAVLKNAPQAEYGFFAVPKVIE